MTCNYTANSQLAGKKVTKAIVGLGEAEEGAVHVCVCVLDRCIAQVWLAQVRGSGRGRDV